MPFIRLLFISLLIFSPLSENTYTFEDLGLGNIVIEPLSTASKKAYFSSTIASKANINITIYHNGSLVISIEINGVKAKLGEKKFIVIQVDLTHNNTITITATNYGTNKAIISGNSTIKIYPANKGNVHNDKSSIWLKISFILSIVSPPLIILAIRRYARVEEEESKEIVVV